jgi:Ca2+:H+ antiporter
MSWLLIFVPVAILLEHFAPERYMLIFASSAIAIIPLASWMSRATESIAERAGAGIGGFLNATFGNAAELIIAFSALRAGLYDLVKASLVGSIVGNMLFVLGLSMFAGGLRHKEQRFNPAGGRSQTTMLIIATIALILPAAYRGAEATDPAKLGPLSVTIAIILLATYAANLIYSLGTHRELFSGSESGEGEAHGAHGPGWSVGRAAAVLAGATVLIAWVSEILVGAIEPAGHALGLSAAFVGVFVVAVLATAAEWITAVKAALSDRLDLSLSIAMGSSVQIALFVSPLLVLASYAFGPSPMDLVFANGLVVTVLLATLIAVPVTADGRSDWLKGLQLLAVYVILGILYFFAPNRGA